jgi:NADH dehydrogenase/NADH:ubiquinone oxidoreductase subunit G
MRIDEVSLVDRGANPGAHISFWKKEGKMSSLGSRIMKAIRSLGPSPSSAEVEEVVRKQDGMPRDFMEVLEDRMAFGVAEAMDNRLFALSSAIFEIMVSDAVNKQELVVESLDQFNEKAKEDLPEMLAGRIVKQFEDSEGLVFEKVQEYLESELPEFSGSEGDKMKKKELDVSGLSQEVQEYIEELTKRADASDELQTKYDELEKQGEALRKESERLSKVVEALTKGEAPPQETDTEIQKVLDAVDPKVRETIAPLLKKSEEQGAEIVKLQKAARRTEIQKRVTPFAAIPGSEEEITDLFVKLDEADLLDEVTAILEPMDKAAQRGLAAELGSDAAFDGAGVMEKVGQLATELRKIDSSLTEEGAIAKVFEQHPDLYEQYNAETS